MVKPILKPLARASRSCSPIIAPNKLSIDLNRSTRSANSATKKILNNFYHLTYDATQKSQQDEKSSVVKDKDDAVPPTKPVRDLDKEFNDSASTHHHRHKTTFLDMNKKDQEKNFKDRPYVKVKKALILRMVERIKTQKTAIVELRKQVQK